MKNVNFYKLQFFTRKSGLFTKVNIGTKWPQKLNLWHKYLYLQIVFKLCWLFSKKPIFLNSKIQQNFVTKNQIKTIPLNSHPKMLQLLLLSLAAITLHFWRNFPIFSKMSILDGFIDGWFLMNLSTDTTFAVWALLTIMIYNYI